MLKCKHCDSSKFKLIPSGSATGAYCAECHIWIKSFKKSEIQIINTTTYDSNVTTPDNLTHFSSKELLHELLKRIND